MWWFVLAACGQVPATRVEQAAVVVERQVDGPTDPDCTASPPTEGLVDRESPRIARLEVDRAPTTWTERVWLRDGSRATIVHGGCAHVGVSYRFPIAAGAGLDTCARRYPAALAMVEALPLRADQAPRTGLDDLRGVYAPSDAAAMDLCLFGDGGMVSVTASVEAGEAGMELVIARDVAL